MKKKKEDYVWSILRIVLGWTFLWPFLDKLYGLGFTTAPEASWLAGGSPTFGFLSFATKGPFAEIFQGLAGNVLVDWLFMLGLLLIGLALILGIGVRIAGYAGVTMMVLMFLAGSIPPEHNPLID
ncbi:DoxX family membrane protein [Candidatus Uhrbacteria bacterium]|nr:DoxX family membrane protein [Candidatus Uhrbacteria bacterium]